jgi:hypothetical protein
MIRGEGWQYRLGSYIHAITETENAGVSIFTTSKFVLTLLRQKTAAGLSAVVVTAAVSLLVRKRIWFRRRSPLS